MVLEGLFGVLERRSLKRITEAVAIRPVHLAQKYVIKRVVSHFKYKTYILS